MSLDEQDSFFQIAMGSDETAGLLGQCEDVVACEEVGILLNNFQHRNEDQIPAH